MNSNSEPKAITMHLETVKAYTDEQVKAMCDVIETLTTEAKKKYQGEEYTDFVYKMLGKFTGLQTRFEINDVLRYVKQRVLKIKHSMVPMSNKL